MAFQGVEPWMDNTGGGGGWAHKPLKDKITYKSASLSQIIEGNRPPHVGVT